MQTVYSSALISSDIFLKPDNVRIEWLALGDRTTPEYPVAMIGLAAADSTHTNHDNQKCERCTGRPHQG